MSDHHHGWDRGLIGPVPNFHATYVYNANVAADADAIANATLDRQNEVQFPRLQMPTAHQENFMARLARLQMPTAHQQNFIARFRRHVSVGPVLPDLPVVSRMSSEAELQAVREHLQTLQREEEEKKVRARRDIDLGEEEEEEEEEVRVPLPRAFRPHLYARSEIEALREMGGIIAAGGDAESALASRFLNFMIRTEQEQEHEPPPPLLNPVILIERRRCRRTGRITDREVHADELDEPRPYHHQTMMMCHVMLVEYRKTCERVIADGWGGIFDGDQLLEFRHTIRLQVHQEIELLCTDVYVSRYHIEEARCRLQENFWAEARHFIDLYGARMLVTDRSYWIGRLQDEWEKEFPYSDPPSMHID